MVGFFNNPGIMVLSMIRNVLVDSLNITSKLFILPNDF